MAGNYLNRRPEFRPRLKRHIEPHQYLQEHVKAGVIFHPCTAAVKAVLQ